MVSPSVPAGESVSVIFPAYQEEEYLATAVHAVVDALRADGSAFEVVVVENGSKDRTREVADGLARDLPEVRSLSVDAADYGAALRHGLLSATGTYVVNFDVDLYDLDFLRRAIDAMAKPGGASIIVATKRGEGSVDTRHWSRRVVTGVFSLSLRVGFGLKVSDTHGMKAMRRSDVLGQAEACLFGKDLFDTELVLRVERTGHKTAELPYVVRETRPARTPIASRIFRSIKGLGQLRVALWREQLAARRASRHVPKSATPR